MFPVFLIAIIEYMNIIPNKYYKAKNKVGTMKILLVLAMNPAEASSNPTAVFILS